MKTKSIFLLLLTIFSIGSLKASPPSTEKIDTFLRKVSQESVYFSAGVALSYVSLVSRVGWALALPLCPAKAGEALLLSQLTWSLSHHLFHQMFKERPLSQRSWDLNHQELSQIPAHSKEDQALLHFLEKRWLAKCSGFDMPIVDWVCPCFDISIQVHPESSNTYARDIVNHFSHGYNQSVQSWKTTLPQPENFPLILTRPESIIEHLPPTHVVSKEESLDTLIEKVGRTLQTKHSIVLVDLTDVLTSLERPTWLLQWQEYKGELSQKCRDKELDTKRIVCIQRVANSTIGGLRLLPLFEEELTKQDLALREWISKSGLTANRIELDRFETSLEALALTLMPPKTFDIASKQEYLDHLCAYETRWHCDHPQKTFMVKASIHILKGLLQMLSQTQWDAIATSETKSQLVNLSLAKIKQEFSYINEQENLFETASHLEQIHAHLSTLLEIFLPFTSEDFSALYCTLLKAIPSNLKPLLTCGVHASGMTTFAGAIQVLEEGVGGRLQILYGENTYFENIAAAELMGEAQAIEKSTPEECERADLLIAQFNPVLRRVDAKVAEYRVEKVADNLRKILHTKREKPLTLLLDSTLDFLDSQKVSELLSEFQGEIEEGRLNVICYRSGLKFDLFGMDNYCGAPYFMIHNADAKWSAFNTLKTDLALQTDDLSLNWFCLAYRYAPQELELYQKQIFDNTRELLNHMPARLFTQQPYRVVPIAKEAEAPFIDVKVTGMAHSLRAALLVSGTLFLTCMENGHPIFYRQSMGFYHPNFCVIFSKECTTIRLTIGLDPDQIEPLVSCFERIDALNQACSPLAL